LAATSGHDNKIRLYDLKSGKVLHTFAEDHDGKALQGCCLLAFGAGGKRLLAGHGHDILEWDVKTKKPAGKKKRQGKFLSPDGKVALTFSFFNDQPRCTVYDAVTGDVRGSVDVPETVMNQVTFSHDSSRAIAVGDLTLPRKGIVQIIGLKGAPT